MEYFLKNQYFVAFFWGYLVSGVAAYVLTYILMALVWKKTTNSYKKMYETEKVPPELDSEKRKPFNWAPRLIGFLERVFYTSAVIFGQFTLIVVWIAFKAIGEWSDISSVIKKSANKEEEKGISRIRANNFLIGNALSLLFGILGGVIFRLVLNQNFLVEIIQNSYK